MRRIETLVPSRPPMVEVLVQAMCDKCGGEMIAVPGVILMSDPPQYPHRCNKCESTENYLEAYPHHAWREKRKERGLVVGIGAP